MNDTLKLNAMDEALFRNEKELRPGIINEFSIIVESIVARALRDRNQEFRQDPGGHFHRQGNRLAEELTSATYTLSMLERPDYVTHGMDRVRSADALHRTPAILESFLTHLNYKKVTGLSEEMLARLNQCGVESSDKLVFETRE